MSDMYLSLLLLLFFWNVSTNAFPENEAERVTVQEGDTAVLSCSITEKGLPPVIVWRKADSVLPLTVGVQVFVEDVRIEVRKVVHDTERQNWDLLLQRAALSDQGIYLCEGASRHKSRVLKLYSLEVTPQPAEIPEISGMSLTGTEKVKQGDKIHLVCIATGVIEPSEDIDWFIRGTKVRAQDRVTVKKRRDLSTRSIISELEINHSQMGDTGIYVCRSSNLLIQSISVLVFYSGSRTTAKTPASVTTTQSHESSCQPIQECIRVVSEQDETGTENTNDSSASEEITKDMVMTARMEFYREQILTDRKRRQIMDTEKEFYEAMLRFLKQQEKQDAQ